MKKTTILLFVIALFVSVTGNAEIFTGNCGKNGDNLTYTLDTSTGLLKIEGSGEMGDYEANMLGTTAPWSSSYYIRKVELSDSVTSIGDYAFADCTRLSSISISNSVTRIGDGAFFYCPKLSSITIPNSVTSIGESVFTFTNLTKLNYNAKNATVFSSSFPNTITTLNIGNEVESIPSYFVGNCSGLTSITIPNSVTSIGSSAFYGCYFSFDSFINLSSLTDSANWGATICDEEQQDGLLIKNNIAIKCRKWATSITIPNSVTSIKNNAFDDCSNLTSITIGNSVTSIENDAFYKCSGLTSITIPNSVTSIGMGAFWGCSSLTSITIPDSVTSIGDDAFYGCSSLTSIIIPNSVTSIGNGTFSGCSGLTSITIPNSVTSIESSAFYGCSGLTEIHSNNITPPTCNIYSTFTGVNTATCKLYVPTGSKEAYASADVWKKFVHIIEEDIINTDSKIEKPTISYENSALKFTSSTPDVKFSYSIQVEDATPTLTEVQDDGIKLSATYIITAYAKTESATSEPATATLVWVDAKLTTDGETTELQSVKAHPILVSSNGGKVTITGLGDNEIVDVYSLSGSKLSTVNSAHGCASFNGIPNSAVIVKVGNRSVKVIVK